MITRKCSRCDDEVTYTAGPRRLLAAPCKACGCDRFTYKTVIGGALYMSVDIPVTEDLPLPTAPTLKKRIGLALEKFGQRLQA